MKEKILIRLNKDLCRDFPDITLEVLRANLPAQGELERAINSIAFRFKSAISNLSAFEPITTIPELAVWRVAYQKLGIKPSKFPSSIEALLRRAKKGELGRIGIPAVDLYNMVSVINRVPMGAYDCAKLRDKSIELRYALPDDDDFSPLGGRQDGFPLNPKLAVYAQGNEILCWGFNTRDSAKTVVDVNSSRVLFFSEAVTSEFSSKSIEALEELSALIVKSGGTTEPIAKFSASNAENYV